MPVKPLTLLLPVVLLARAAYGQSWTMVEVARPYYSYPTVRAAYPVAAQACTTVGSVQAPAVPAYMTPRAPYDAATWTATAIAPTACAPYSVGGSQVIYPYAPYAGFGPVPGYPRHHVGRNLFGEPTVFARYEPVRNVLRFLLP
jgi:hypothetical protein